MCFCCHALTQMYAALSHFKQRLQHIMLYPVLFTLLKPNKVARCCWSRKEKQHYFYPKAQSVSSRISFIFAQMLKFTEQLKASSDIVGQVI